MIGRRRVRPGRAWAAAALGGRAGGDPPCSGRCSLRDRSNPLDPKNRTTRGQLTGFALAGIASRSSAGRSSRRPAWRLARRPLDAGRRRAVRPLRGAGDVGRGTRSRTTPPTSIGWSPGSPRGQRFDPGHGDAGQAHGGDRGRPAAGALPDARSSSLRDESSEAFGDIDLDPREAAWLSQVERGLITSRTFEQVSGIEFDAPHPSDLAVTPQQRRGGLGGAAGTVPGLEVWNRRYARGGHPRSRSGTRWRRTASGRCSGSARTTGASSRERGDAGPGRTWRFAGQVNPVAVDESADAAWAAVRVGELVDLYRVTAGDPTPALVRSGLVNVTDLDVEPATHTVWVCERGVPRGERTAHPCRCFRTGPRGGDGARALRAVGRAGIERVLGSRSPVRPRPRGLRRRRDPPPLAAARGALRAPRLPAVAAWHNGCSVPPTMPRSQDAAEDRKNIYRSLNRIANAAHAPSAGPRPALMSLPAALVADRASASFRRMRMPRTRQKLATLDAVEEIARRVPGYKGYQELSQRREDDRRLQQHRRTPGR